MTFALDANVLLLAANESAAGHPRAREVLRRAVEGDELVYIFWPVAMAYLSVSTHARVFPDPISPAQAAADIAFLAALPHVRFVGEGPGFWAHYRRATANLTVRGNLVTDAHIVALMHQHGVTTIWSNDRDFRKFDGVRVLDPLA